MSAQRWYFASDYAGLDTDKARLYYGYERTWCEKHGDDKSLCDEDDECDPDWCFVATFPRDHGGYREVVIPSSKLGTHDQFNVAENLLAGLGLLLSQGELIERADDYANQTQTTHSK